MWPGHRLKKKTISQQSFKESLNKALELTVGGESGELGGGASQLEVLWASGRGEGRGSAVSGCGGWDNSGAVDEVRAAVTEDGELGHGGFEGVLELRLVVYGQYTSVY